MSIDKNSRRWKNTYSYLETLPIEEKRRFYAGALKFFLDEKYWDDDLRPPRVSDHDNLRDMLNAFNSLSRTEMAPPRTSPDIELQHLVVKPIRRGKKRRVRKKQISRFTYEMMQVIRDLHPVGNGKGPTKKKRVKGMSKFQKQLKSRFYGK